MDTLDKDDNEEKRQVPPALQNLLQIDVQLTKRFLSATANITVFKSFKTHAKLLEWSCHGIVWLAGWLGFIYLINKSYAYQTQVNMMIGLILDIVIIAVTKAFVRRRRPAPTSNTMALGPDKYSFPSGHSSRSVFVAFFFIYLSPLPMIFYPPLLAWVVAVSVSRVLLQRHYILDVLAGIGIGLVEGVVVGLIWFSQSTSAELLYLLSDEKLDGGEYHV